MFKTISRASSFLLSRNSRLFGRSNERNIQVNSNTNYCPHLTFLSRSGMATSSASSAGTSSGEPKFTNRLAQEKSPYLLQHAHNPVDWYPWGDEAIQKARDENKLIFLSVGYSTCHWCHVMEHESFENEEVAKIMNDNFINIKVDREERPDIDKIYMNFVLMINGSGGWPMSVWLTPDLAPISAGTYFPPKDRWGMPGFSTVLRTIAEKWKKNQTELKETGSKIIKVIEKNLTEKPAEALDPESAEAKLDLAIRIYKRNYDEEYGGLGNHPKFPEVSRLNLLFHAYTIKKDPEILQIALNTLEKIANGGIHDHVFGGFARYSVDRKWHVPHFEKMLYDQGQLMSAYANAYKITRNDFYLETAHNIFEYLMKDLYHPYGAFYSGEDADSLPTADDKLKVEGAFYAWTWDEVREAIENNAGKFEIDAKKAFEIYCYHYDINETGNVEPASDPHGHLTAKNILIVRNSINDTAKKFNIEIPKLKHTLSVANDILHKIRDKRPRPHLDTKIITSWNGLVLSGLSKLANCFSGKRSEYLSAAEKLVDFIRNFSFDKEKQILLRSCYGKGVGDNSTEILSEPIAGFLDDYAFLIRGLLDYFQASMDPNALLWAKELQDIQDSLFWDTVNGGYYYSQENSPNVIVRLKEDHDGAEPCGNSIAARNLLLLSVYYDEPKYKDQAKKLLNFFSDVNPFGYVLPEMMSALLLLDQGFNLSAVVGPSSEVTERFINILRKYYVPGLIMVHFDPEKESFIRQNSREKFKMIKNTTTVYICHNKVCQLPMTCPVKLEENFNLNYLAK
ncbi:uncharacterized protein B0495.5 [Condylostylus longicornis]|uniref:uncharacterized protein B0495.5 n=1 Tax=Condylostylus longicornis TaxID=2530218 RepID=UPI00244E0FDC|nr:uncharacterized protein B0495.5 [Condylostylus longicornis]